MQQSSSHCGLTTKGLSGRTHNDIVTHQNHLTVLPGAYQHASCLMDVTSLGVCLPITMCERLALSWLNLWEGEEHNMSTLTAVTQLAVEESITQE